MIPLRLVIDTNVVVSAGTQAERVATHRVPAGNCQTGPMVCHPTQSWKNMLLSWHALN